MPDSKKTLMTQTYYKENDGDLCPVCHSSELTGDMVEIEGTSAYQSVSCNKCHSNWVDVYELNRYDNLKKGE